MLFTCVICAELVNQSDILLETYVTPCGHIFHHTCIRKWLERSKTCPQCRNNCSLNNIHRIYFNIANIDATENNYALLEQQLELANIKNRASNTELEAAKKEIEFHKKTHKNAVKVIKKLEQKVSQKDIKLGTYMEMIKAFKIDSKALQEREKEINELKQQLNLMSTVQKLLENNGPEVERLLKDENDPKTLAMLVTTLKRNLRQSENKRADLKTSLVAIQQDLKNAQKEKSLLEEKVISLESENYRLSDNAVLQIKEGNLNKNKTSDDSTKMLNDLKNNNNLSIIKISPKLSENIKKIEESNSPYLNIKSSGVGLQVLPKFKDKKIVRFRHLDNLESNQGSLKRNKSDLSEKYSILKKPRLHTSFGRNQNTDMVFDGFGSSERRDFLLINNKRKCTLSNNQKI